MQQSFNSILIHIWAFLLVLGGGIARAQVTTVTVHQPQTPVRIDPMIYGQMLENVSDSMVYGGVTDLQGNVRRHLIPLLHELQIPVMRWPGGTVVYEYNWKDGIGPKERRPTIPNLAWGGVETYQFGTDEFLQWCQEIGTTPYVNLNMSLHPDHPATVSDALEWIAYVNGDQTTEYGRLRAKNGHPEPYGVMYWGIGNENYLNNRAGRVQETAVQYAARLKQWASTIRRHYPQLHLLGIGHTQQWNQRVLDSCGEMVDFLTQHYYVNSQVKAGKIQGPLHSLFAPLKMEAHLAMLGRQLTDANARYGREDRPIRLSVDEWNNRHQVYGNGKYTFSRLDTRRQFDVPIAAGMLNVFIRQSQFVGMANYIFPVNAHGLILTVGQDDAYTTPLYPLFEQYRRWMTGHKMDVEVTGPGVAADSIQPNIDGDAKETGLTGLLNYVDASSTMDQTGILTVALANRDPLRTQSVAIQVPHGYLAVSTWTLQDKDVNATNTATDRQHVKPNERTVKAKPGAFKTKLLPCAVMLIRFARTGPGRL